MQETTGIIFDIKRYAIHDGPGIRTTVFFKGCPLRCWWCHNPESQSPRPEIMLRANRCILCGACQADCPQGAIQLDRAGATTDRTLCDLCAICVDACYSGARELSGREMTVHQVLAEIERDIPFYDQSGGGVTFSGGEPLLQPAFLSALLHACRQRGIHTVLDTSGYTSWDTLERIRDNVDLFLYDLKLLDPVRHVKYTGVSNHLILSNLRALSGHGHRLLVRMPIIPGINDAEADLRAAGDFLACLPHLEGVELLGYHHTGLAKYETLGRSYLLPETPPPGAELLGRLAGILQDLGLPVHVELAENLTLQEDVPCP